MPKFIIATLGCKVNQYESEALARELEASGWITAQRHEQADVCIVNTCTVTRKAAMQSRQAMRQAIRKNPGARIVVTGCYAQTEADEIKKIKGVHAVIGQAQKHNLTGLILSEKEYDFNHPISICSDIRRERRFGQFSETVYGSRTRPFLKIQDGCESFCTYCIVPFARGPSRSMPLADVLENILQLSQAGYHEVVLSGIHLGNYGLDLSPETDLFDLLSRIRESNLIHRVRLSSIEPLELTAEIIKLVSESKNFCRHFHIPLQSGDDLILKKMNRPYTRAFFRERVLQICERMPDAAIGVDVLIGFPGETDAAFENTYSFIQQLPLAYLHVFPFSPRPATAAATFPDRVPPKVIKKRCQRMRKLGSEKRASFYNKFIGDALEVLIEETPDHTTRLLKGISSNYIPVLTNASDDHRNKIVHVGIEDLYMNNLLFGKIILESNLVADNKIERH